MLAAENEIAVVIDAIVAQKRAGGMAHRHIKDGCHLAALYAVAHERPVAAPAEGERKTVEKDRFTGAGLARQHGKTRLESKIKPFDQDDIADR